VEGDSHTGLLAPLEALARAFGYRVAYLDHAAVLPGAFAGAGVERPASEETVR
jgi:hypothetical protein